MNDFDERFDALAAIAYRVAFRILGDRADAEEIAQETMARAYARWRSVAGHAEPWVAKVATNLALGAWRKRRAQLPLDAEAGSTGDDAMALALERHGLVAAARLRLEIGEVADVRTVR